MVCFICGQSPVTYSLERVGGYLGKVGPLPLCDRCFVALMPLAIVNVRLRLRDQARRERLTAEKDEEGAARDLSA